MLDVLVGVIAAASRPGGAGPTPGPATVVQEGVGRSFAAPTTVGNTVLWVCRNYGARSDPVGDGWTVVKRETPGVSHAILVWATAVTSPFTSFDVSNPGNVSGNVCYEISGLDNTALDTPQSLHSAAAVGAYPATSFSGITDERAFGLFVCGTSGGSAGGSPDVYAWAGSVAGEFSAYTTNDIYNQDQSMSGGAAAPSVVVAVISVAFKSG